MAEPHQSLVQRLLNDLQGVEARLDTYIKATRIGRHRYGSYLDDLDTDGKRVQADLLKAHQAWRAHINLLFRDAPKKTREAVDEANVYLNSCIERDGPGWWVPSNISVMRERCNEFLARLREALAGLTADDGPPPIVLLPDTNALLASADWERYATIAGVEKFSIVIPPSVLKELDKLKVQHREQAFREKVSSVIRRIKGLRNQGSLLDGVTVARTIRIRLIAAEPDFSTTLQWLDPNNDDDRIIASSLELQRHLPSSVVVLVTSDINMQTKAEAAKLPFAEPPDATP